MAASAIALCFGGAVLLLLGGASSTPIQNSDLQVSVETVPDIGAFRLAHPDLSVVTLAPTTEVITKDGVTRQQLIYTVGSRGANDRLVGLSSDSKSWSSPQDVTLQLQYPTAGVGAVVSYVEVVVTQSTNQGRGYIVAGGVGQRHIRLVIESYSTLFFTYTAAIYGF